VNLRCAWLIAKGVLIEAVRRREIYVIVLVSTLLIGLVMLVDFFDVQGLSKFHREIALRIMSIATALTVVVLAARQLPREFERRTIYPLLARPIGRPAFLAGKLLGVMLAASLCFGLFMGIYVIGSLRQGASIPWALFSQFIFLQMLMMLILATLSFWLSLLLNLDAAITVGALFYALAATFTNVTVEIYQHIGTAGKYLIVFLTYALPQLTLFDLSAKAVHAEAWDPVRLQTMLILTAYALIFSAAYFGLAAHCFRRRPL
jgi:ABC-type transport system involved in multi-copper enzyme maturation permease subunit